MPANQSPTDLPARITDWLASQGYPLEMAAARLLQAAGFNTVQSDYYADPETEDNREIDLVASMQREVAGLYIRVTLVIECKVSRDKPWLLFTSPETSIATPARLRQRAATPAGHLLLAELAQDEGFANLALLQSGRCPGYGLTEAFTSGQDKPYAALMGAAKAAAARTREGLATPVAELAFPVIVLDGRLFDCSLREDHIEVAEIDSGVLLWRNPVVGMPHTIIHVVSFAGLSKFIADARDSARLILTREAAIEGAARVRARRLRGERLANTIHKLAQSFPFAR